jgi:hypothetical protein
MPINYLVNDCTHDGWRGRACATVAGLPTSRKLGYRVGAGWAAHEAAVSPRAEDRSNLVNDPEYPSDAVIREVARKLAELFCGE